MEEIKFEKVSFDQFRKDCINLGYINEDEIKEAYDGLKLPKRGTAGSAGYDFVTPFAFDLINKIVVDKNCNEYDLSIATIPTGIRVKMPKGKALILMPRSGLGFKTGMSLANTLGLIDSDYSYSDNEGHIMAKFVRGFKDLHVNQFERVMQGVFIDYYTTEDDDTDGTRNGGFGSTGSL